MTLEEAIAHAREVASAQKDKCEQCAADHKQLAKWLEELKYLRQGKADAIDEFLDLFMDELTEAEHSIETESGDTYGLTSNEICGCIESAKEKLKEQNKQN